MSQSINCRRCFQWLFINRGKYATYEYQMDVT